MRAGQRTGAIAIAVASLAFAIPTSAAGSLAGVPGREADPIVLDGAAVPELIGAEPDEVVAFGYDGGWKQIPVQVDERAIVDYRTVRQSPSFGAFSHEAYTDPGTYAGPDPDPMLDGNDEIAMMAKDAGRAAGEVPSPSGVDPATRTVVSVDDPVGSARRFVYLFRTDSGLDPAAGEAYVEYDFSLDSGDYKSTYDWNGVADNGAGPPANPEDSSVTTEHYSKHLRARWVEDELAISTGAATGVDILDGDKVQVFFGCGRSELTFSRGGGGFIANKSGPVRAIRSYIGANSGTYTQQDRIYYERSEVMKTYLRVHPGISVIDQFLDYSPAAAGMTYRTSEHPAGVTIDGIPDPALETGNALGPEIEWEQATGAQGSLTIVSRVETDIPTFAAGSYYQDDSSSPATPQCGGYADNQAWGSSGPGISGAGVNTDPTLGAASSLTGTRTTFYDAPGADAALAELRSDQIDRPLTVAADADREPRRPGRLGLRVGGRALTLEPGETVRVPVTVRNRGQVDVNGVRLCARAPERMAQIGRCKRARSLSTGDQRRLRIRVTATDRPRRWVSVRYRVTAKNARPDEREVKIPIVR